MNVRLTIWYLRKFAKDRGYALTQEDWKEYKFYSDKTMKKKLLQWLKEKKQGEE